MRKHCCGTGELVQGEDAEHIANPVSRLLDGLMAMSGEVNEKLGQISRCPRSCNDGMVEIGVSSGRIRKTACPVMNSKCQYGQRMERTLDRFVMGIMSGIGVPRRHLDNLMAECQTEVLRETGKWSTQGFLILTGGTGSGKSFGAASVVHKYLKSLVTSHFDQQTWVKAEQGADTVIWCAAADIIDERETAALVKQRNLAVIDDLGGEPESSLGQAALRGVLLKRHDMKLPTVITTSLTMLDIDLRYGGRVADRLTEDIGSGGMFIECGDISMRSPRMFPALGEK